MPDSAAFLAEMAAVVGAAHVLTQPADVAGYVRDWTGKFSGRALAVVRPATTREVSRVVALCARENCPIIAQGGNTGLSGGATPDSSGAAVILSLTRMRRVRQVDSVGQTISVDAGCALQTVQEEAAKVGLYFPLSLSSEGTCTIGGTVATNAGGVAVLRYGAMRALTLGLEVVLPDGRVWDGMYALRKDNTGYALRDLFIGSEGTLGVITGAVLKLHAQPLAQATAFVAVDGLAQALAFLAMMHKACGDQLGAFEFMEKPCLDLIAAKVKDVRMPFASVPAAVVLVELSHSGTAEALHQSFEAVLAQALEQGIVRDVVLAQNQSQSRAFWRVRESISEALVAAGKAAKHDIALPTENLIEFVAAADAFVRQASPGARPIVFGHLGDGNLHYNVIAPEAGDTEAFYAEHEALAVGVHDLVQAHRGSISAEHGIGQMRLAELERVKPALDLELMRRIKAGFDPAGIMNPGKLMRL